MEGLNHGTLLFISEIVDRQGNDDSKVKTVRTIGRLSKYDADNAQAVLEHEGKSLTVDMSLVADQFEFKLNGLFQCIGEVSYNEEAGSILKARIVGKVDGIDFSVYAASISLQREHALDTL